MKELVAQTPAKVNKSETHLKIACECQPLKNWHDRYVEYPSIDTIRESSAWPLPICLVLDCVPP